MYIYLTCLQYSLFCFYLTHVYLAHIYHKLLLTFISHIYNNKSTSDVSYLTHGYFFYYPDLPELNCKFKHGQVSQSISGKFTFFPTAKDYKIKCNEIA